MKKFKIHRSTYHLIVSILLIALIVGINFGANFLTEKYSWSFDLTQNKIYSLSDDSKQYLSTIDTNIEIIILNSKEKFLENDNMYNNYMKYFQQADLLINEYSKYNDKISVRYVELTENPGFKSEYPNESLYDNNVIIKSGDKHKVLTTNDLFDMYQSNIGASKTEKVLTSALINVLSDDKAKIAFLTGFDEAPFTDFENMLNLNNYEILHKSLLTDSIDKDVPIVIIPAPARDYDDDAIKKLKDYINSDSDTKNIVMFVSAEYKSMPKLDAFLNEYGIKIGDGFVYEDDISKLFSMNGLLNSPFSTLSEYVDFEFTRNLKNTSIPVAMPLSKPIEILDKDKVTILLQMSGSASIRPNKVDKDWKPTPRDSQDPIPVAVRYKFKNDEQDKVSDKGSNIIVFSSVMCTDNTVLSKSSLNNSLYFLGMFNKLSNKSDTSLNIEPKSESSLELNITPQLSVIIGLTFGIILPALVILAGIIVLIIRKKKV